jgi:hypothetical protein
MKLFNVHLEVSISFAGELQESPAPQESFVDLVEGEKAGSDPMKLQAKVLDKLYVPVARYSAKIDSDGRVRVIHSRIDVPSPGLMFYPGHPEGVSMSQNVKIAASSFEELILARFHDVAESLQVPA